MEKINICLSVGLFFLLLQSSHVRSQIPVLQLCQVGEATSDQAYINMNTSLIYATNGSCECYIDFTSFTELELSFPNVTSPKCDTRVSLSDPIFQITCNDSHMQSESQMNKFDKHSGFWIHVKTNGSSQPPISGTIKLRTKHRTNFNLRCFGSIITSQPLSTPTTPTPSTSTPPPTTITQPSPTTTTKTTTSTIITDGTTTTTITSSTEPITNKPVYYTTEGSNASTKSNAVAPGLRVNELPVMLTVGCVVGGVVVIGVIRLVVFCHRRKKKRVKRKTTMTHDPSPIQKDDRNNDYIISMENELYCSSGEMLTSSNFNHVESSEGTEMDEQNTSSVIAPNGDVYAIVDRSLKVKYSPQRNQSYSISPSGDVYAVVAKSKSSLRSVRL